jgi:hypothetical protein
VGVPAFFNIGRFEGFGEFHGARAKPPLSLKILGQVPEKSGTSHREASAPENGSGMAVALPRCGFRSLNAGNRVEKIYTFACLPACLPACLLSLNHYRINGL